MCLNTPRIFSLVSRQYTAALKVNDLLHVKYFCEVDYQAAVAPLTVLVRVVP